MMYSRKMTEHYKPAIMGKNKNHYVKKPKKKKKIIRASKNMSYYMLSVRNPL